MVLNMDCTDLLAPLSMELYESMSTSIGNYRVQGANNIDPTCNVACDVSSVTVSNIRWTMNDALNPLPEPPAPEPVPEPVEV